MDLPINKEQQIKIYQALVKDLDGQTKAKDALEVAQSTISGWENGDHFMSPKTAIKAERITHGKYSRLVLSPDLREAELGSKYYIQPQESTNDAIIATN